MYYFYGDEPFLTDTYTKRVLKKTVGDNDVNLVKFSETFTTEQLSDSVESMPLFSEYKAVLIKDFEAEKLSDDEISITLEILADVPEECTVIFSQTNISAEALKKSKAKKFIDKLSKQDGCCVCKFSALPPAKTADLIIKKAEKNGCVISRQNAMLLVELTLNDIMRCSVETDKLCSYAGSGEITSGMIEKSVLRMPDAKAYLIGTAVAQNDRKKAFALLDDLIAQRVKPIIILSALSSAYIDFYRAVCAKKAGRSPAAAASDFEYPKNRAFLMEKAFNTTRKISPESIRKCISLLNEADLKLKSTNADERTVLEQTIAGLLQYV